MSLGSERGQATVEWVGLMLLLAILFGALLGFGAAGIPGLYAAEFRSSLLCSFGVESQCPEQQALAAEYGDEVANLVSRHAPGLVFEDGARWLPVDFRDCGDPDCDGRWLDDGDWSPYRPGDRPSGTAFTRVIDCRDPFDKDADEVSCKGPRTGNLYITYWLYYPESSTFEGIPLLEDEGYHKDDWESFQVRVGADGVKSRASSHSGYNHTRSLANWASDVGATEINEQLEAVDARPKGGWGTNTGRIHISSGSQAGNVASRDTDGTTVQGDDLHLHPLEPLARDTGMRSDFGSITPPWEKAVWTDPEVTHTG